MQSNRGFTTGMFFGMQPDDGYNHDDPHAYRRSHELVGVVTAVSNGTAEVALRNTLNTGDTIMFLSTGLENELFRVSEILNEKGDRIETGRNENTVHIPVLPGVRAQDLIRRPLAPSL